MANEDDVKLQFGADFTSALQSVNDFFDGIRRSTVGSGTGLGKLPEELEEVSVAAKQTTAQVALMTIGLGAALAAFAALTAAAGVLFVAFQGIKLAGGFFVDSLQLAMKAEDEAYEKAVKLAEAQGRLPPANHTLSESFRELSAVVDDAKAQLGEAFLPIMKELIPIAIVFAERMRDIAKAWAEWAAETAGDSGLSNIEDTIIKILAYFETLLESLDILAIKWRVFNEITTVFFWNEEEQNKALAELGRKLVDEGMDSSLVRETINSGGPGFDKRLERNEEELRRDVEVRRNQERPGGTEDAIVKNRQNILDAFNGATKLIAEGVIEGSKKGSKLYEGFTDKAQSIFDEYAKGVAESEEVQWAEARKIVAGFAEPEKKDRFQGGIEDSVSVFRRIQSAMGNQEEIPKQQLTVAQEQLKRMVEARDAQLRIDGGIGELISVVKGGVPAVAQ